METSQSKVNKPRHDLHKNMVLTVSHVPRGSKTSGMLDCSTANYFPRHCWATRKIPSAHYPQLFGATGKSENWRHTRTKKTIKTWEEKIAQQDVQWWWWYCKFQSRNLVVAASTIGSVHYGWKRYTWNIETDKDGNIFTWNVRWIFVMKTKSAEHHLKQRSESNRKDSFETLCSQWEKFISDLSNIFPYKSIQIKAEQQEYYYDLPNEIQKNDFNMSKKCKPTINILKLHCW